MGRRNMNGNKSKNQKLKIVFKQKEEKIKAEQFNICKEKLMDRIWQKVIGNDHYRNYWIK